MKLIIQLLCTLPCLFSNFPVVIHVEQLAASIMMLQKAHFVEIFVYPNGHKNSQILVLKHMK